MRNAQKENEFPVSAQVQAEFAVDRALNLARNAV